MKKGIALAGNIILDISYYIDRYPSLGDLATISGEARHSIGGSVCNTILDLARLDPCLPLKALGVVGDDENGRLLQKEMGDYKNIDLSQIRTKGSTSVTIVMNDAREKQRTFFQYRGANALFCEEDIDFDSLEADLFHIGYLLLLDTLDEPDKTYGTKMAKLLAKAKSKGFLTSIDIVSDAPEKFKSVVPPALKYTDYCIINEIEAERTTGVKLCGESGLVEEHMPDALFALQNMGVAAWAVIHSAQVSYGLDCRTGTVEKLDSIHLPPGYIKENIGAGDAFCAGVLYSAYQGHSLYKALETGTATAVASLGETGTYQGVSGYDTVMDRYRTMKEKEHVTL